MSETTNDYIKREDAIKQAKDLFELGECYCDQHSIVGMLNALPSADVVDVVRCRECKHWHKYIDIENGQGWCGNNRTGLVVHSGWTTHEDFFCADGERKDNE